MAPRLGQDGPPRATTRQGALKVPREVSTANGPGPRTSRTAQSSTIRAPAEQQAASRAWARRPAPSTQNIWPGVFSSKVNPRDPDRPRVSRGLNRSRAEAQNRGLSEK